jgi:hypothetical protein
MNKKEALKSALEGEKITSPGWGKDYITWSYLKGNFVNEKGQIYYIENMKEGGYEIYKDTFKKKEAIQKMLDGLRVKNKICNNDTSYYFDPYYQTFKHHTNNIDIVTCFNINNLPDDYWYL